MSWSTIPNAKLVSFNDVQGSGISLKSGQSHTSNDKLIAKDELTTKYNVKLSLLTGLASNQLVQRSLVENNLITNFYAYEAFDYREAAWNTYYQCGNLNQTITSNKQPSDFIVGDFVDVPNGPGYYALNGKVFRIAEMNSSGLSYLGVAQIYNYIYTDIVNFYTEKARGRFTTAVQGFDINITNTPYADIPTVGSGTYRQEYIAVKAWIGFVVGAKLYTDFDGLGPAGNCVYELLSTDYSPSYLKASNGTTYTLSQFGVITNINTSSSGQLYIFGEPFGLQAQFVVTDETNGTGSLTNLNVAVTVSFNWESLDALLGNDSVIIPAGNSSVMSINLVSGGDSLTVVNVTSVTPTSNGGQTYNI